MTSTPIMQEDNPLLQDAIMQPLVMIFLERLPATIDNMEQALKNSDWASMARYAHQIKGTAGSFGYGSLTNKAAQLEKYLKADDIQSARQIYIDIKYYVLGAE